MARGFFAREYAAGRRSRARRFLSFDLRRKYLEYGRTYLTLYVHVHAPSASSPRALQGAAIAMRPVSSWCLLIALLATKSHAAEHLRLSKSQSGATALQSAEEGAQVTKACSSVKCQATAAAWKKIDGTNKWGSCDAGRVDDVVTSLFSTTWCVRQEFGRASCRYFVEYPASRLGWAVCVVCAVCVEMRLRRRRL